MTKTTMKIMMTIANNTCPANKFASVASALANGNSVFPMPPAVRAFFYFAFVCLFVCFSFACMHTCIVNLYGSDLHLLQVL